MTLREQFIEEGFNRGKLAFYLDVLVSRLRIHVNFDA